MNYPEFPKECRSLLCKYLTPDVFERLQNKKTSNGFTLEQAINSGIKIPTAVSVSMLVIKNHTMFSDFCSILLLKIIMDSGKTILIAV